MVESKKGLIPKSVQRILAAITSISLFLFSWYLATEYTDLGILMPGPQEAFLAFFESFYTNIGSYTIIGHTLWSLSRVLIAFTAAAIAGITLGLYMGWYRIAEAIFMPLYSIIRPIPPIAWIPLAILWFGLGEMTKYFLIFLAAFSNITLNAYTGAREVDKTVVGAAKMLGANDRQIFTTIVLPSSVPYIFAGLQVAISSSWATVVAAEMVRSSEGVGWVIVSGQEMGNITQILVGIIAIGIVGFLLAIIMRGVEAKLCAWNNKGV